MHGLIRPLADMEDCESKDGYCHTGTVSMCEADTVMKVKGCGCTGIWKEPAVRCAEPGKSVMRKLLSEVGTSKELVKELGIKVNFCCCQGNCVDKGKGEACAAAGKVVSPFLVTLPVFVAAAGHFAANSHK